MILTGAGQIGMAIARRTGYGKKIIVGDRKIGNAEIIAGIMNTAGFDADAVEMDLSSRESILNLIEYAGQFGEITTLVRAASGRYGGRRLPPGRPFIDLIITSYTTEHEEKEHRKRSRRNFLRHIITPDMSKEASAA